MGCVRFDSFLVTSLIQIPSKQLTSRKRIRAASQHLVPLRRVMYYCHLLSYLCWLAVTWRADGAALLSPRISPDDTGHPPSHCKAVKLFCSGTSGFQGSLFLLQLLAIVSLHSSALLPPLPSICASGEVLNVWLWFHCRLILVPAIPLLL